MSKPGMHGAFGLFLLTLAIPAAAQTRTGFVEGGLLADYNPTLRSDTTTTAGVSGSAGFFLARRVSLRLEIDYPRWHGSVQSGETRVVQRIEAHELLEERRSPSLSLLVGGHRAHDSRVSVSWLGGVTKTRRDSNTTGWTETRDLQGNVIEHREVARRTPGYTWYAVTAGSDVTIALTKHVALVPQIRVHSYLFSEHTSLVFVRPRITVRWQF